ncbi:hypothetical protein B5E84_17470 [Lachnoclostridium sp. An14]|nr:hypothetical protein B5E84_17470 [Lachnoclostridium sp. An14]
MKNAAGPELFGSLRHHYRLRGQFLQVFFAFIRKKGSFFQVFARKKTVFFLFCHGRLRFRWQKPPAQSLPAL